MDHIEIDNIVFFVESYYPYFFILLGLYYLFRGFLIKRLFKFPFWYLFLGSDIGGNKSPYYFDKKGICGAPDAVFFDILTLSFVIGEYKSRNYNNGVTWRERFQVTLYTGLVPPWFFPRSKGYIAYGCGTVKRISFERKYYKGLLSLKKEVIEAKKIWQPLNNLPLYKRD